MSLDHTHRAYEARIDAQAVVTADFLARATEAENRMKAARIERDRQTILENIRRDRARVVDLACAQFAAEEKRRQAAMDALAAWVNTHDDGSPRPRAWRVDTPQGPAVVICSQVLDLGSGASITEQTVAYTMTQARAVLGY